MRPNGTERNAAIGAEIEHRWRPVGVEKMATLLRTLQRHRLCRQGLVQGRFQDGPIAQLGNVGTGAQVALQAMQHARRTTTRLRTRGDRDGATVGDGGYDVGGDHLTPAITEGIRKIVQLGIVTRVGVTNLDGPDDNVGGVDHSNVEAALHGGYKSLRLARGRDRKGPECTSAGAAGTLCFERPSRPIHE